VGWQHWRLQEFPPKEDGGGWCSLKIGDSKEEEEMWPHITNSRFG
jgi:hypothetical protein